MHHSQKSSQYRTQIRKQHLSKLFSLKRIKPQLVQSDSQALQIVIDGTQILFFQETSQETKIKVLKSIADVLRKYEFDETHKTLVRGLAQYVVGVFDIGVNHRQVVKEAALQLLSCLSFNQLYNISLSMLPFQVLTGFNLKLIKSCLLSLSSLLTYNCYTQNLHSFKTLFTDTKIFNKLLTIIANFIQTPECFNPIKPLFMNCAVTLLVVYHNYHVNLALSDYKQLVRFCVEQVEGDVICEGGKDDSLKVFFERYYQLKTLEDIFEKTNELVYPFGVYQHIIKIVQQPNYAVVHTLTQCLRFQIRSQSVQQPLIRCLSKIYYQTDCKMDDSLKQQLFSYIFALQYSSSDTASHSLRYTILMMTNQFLNNQIPNATLLKYMGDPMHKRWPKTCHLLEVMEFLQLKEDYFTQEKLLELVDAYVNICGERSIVWECWEELKNFEEGVQWMLRSGYVMEGIDGRVRFVVEEEGLGNGEISEWEI